MLMYYLWSQLREITFTCVRFTFTFYIYIVNQLYLYVKGLITSPHADF